MERAWELPGVSVTRPLIPGGEASGPGHLPKPPHTHSLALALTLTLTLALALTLTLTLTPLLWG